MRRRAFVFVFFGVLALTRSASAEPAKEEEEARQRYQRGLGNGWDTNYAASLVEFERAYALSPSYKILYNIGLCHEQLGDYVRAYVTLEKYLVDGGAEISEDRRSEVRKELAQIAPRIGRIRITSDVDVSVRVDGLCGMEATTRAETCVAADRDRVVLSNPGRRQIAIAHADYELVQQNVDVVSAKELVIRVHGPAIPRMEEKNPFVTPMWIAWGIAAATLAGAIVAGVVVADRPDGTAAPLARSGLALGVGAAVAIGAGTYFTVRSLRWKTSPTSEVAFGPLGLQGSF